MSEYSSSIHISWGNPPRFLYSIEKAQLLQAAPSHPILYAHAYFFLCSITPASSATLNFVTSASDMVVKIT